MTSSKSTKRALLTSVLALLMCVTMLVGATFAWFTDTASTAVNKIQAGTLNVDIVDKNGDSLDGKSLSFKDVNNNTDILWEPGATFNLDSFKIVNKGNLAFKYKVIISGVNGNAKLLEAIDFFVKIGDAEKVALADWDGILLPEGKTATTGNEVVGATDLITISGTMKKEAGNEYQGLSIDGIGITVVATQYTYEYDSKDNTYDADAGNDTAFYTLAEFNALTEIPEGVKVAYVNLNGASLEGGLTIGNANIADHYAYTDWNSDVAPTGYPTKVGTDKRASDGATRYIYSTGKPAADIILIGSVTGAKDTGGFNAGSITLKVPDAANVVFEKVNFGAGQMAMSMWTEPNVASMTVPHRVASVTFDGCTFNGNWIQNGAFGADEMVVKNCTFNVHENTGYKNNSNTINAVRPIKLWEGTASGSVTIKNNTFNMSNFVDATGGDAYKNVAVMFCGTTEQVKLGNVEITGNTVTGSATGFVCFYDNSTQHPSMADGATFKLSGNTLNGAKESVIWKTNTEWKPSYVNQ